MIEISVITKVNKRSSFLRNPVFYGIVGFILIAAPSIYFFFIGIPGTEVSETITQTDSGINRTITTRTVYMGTYNPFFLIFILLAGIAAWGCYRNTLLAWVGSLLMLIFSILGMFSIGMLILPGSILLLAGAVLRKFRLHS